MLNPPKTGEIWFAVIADPGSMPSKSRPVLVIEPFIDDDGEFESAFVLGITSKVSNLNDNTEFILEPSKTNGLHVKSAVKFFWGRVIPKKYFDRQRVGKLTREEFQQTMTMLEAFRKKHS
jgi:hypothetical protein